MRDTFNAAMKRDIRILLSLFGADAGISGVAFLANRNSLA
jgi:hypothetical protein